MQITVRHNAREVGRFVGWVFSDQLPYVTAKAINDAAIEAQRRQRAHMAEVFTVRRKRFVMNAVKIKPFADHRRQREPFARVLIDPPGGQDRAGILVRHESDRARVPYSGRKLAVPTEHVKRGTTGVIRNAERPKPLQLREEAGGARPRAARRRTFRKGDTIFEELQDRSIRALWQLVDRTPLDQRLDFIANLTKAVDDTFADSFTRRFDRAIRTARR